MENCDRFLHYNFSGNEVWQKNRPLSSIRFEGVEASGIAMSLCAYGDGDEKLSLELERCRVAFATQQSEFIRAAHVGPLRLCDITVEGVTGPCVRSWGDTAAPDAENLRGVADTVEAAADPFQTAAI